MKKNYLYLYSSALVLYLALILLLCVHFRVSTDDYYYLSEVEKTGVAKIVSSSYFKWSGRFAACAVMNYLFSLLYLHMNYFFLIPLITFILMSVGVHQSLTQLIHYTPLKLNLLSKIALSLSFVALLFFMSFDIGETWFWCSSTGCYLFNVLAFIWGFYFILHPKSNVLTFLGIALCSIFVGGSAEVFAFFFLWILVFFIFYRYKKASGTANFFKNTFHKKLLIALIFLGLSFTILVMAPGNYLRDQVMPPHRFFFSFFVATKSLIKFFILYLPLHLHYIAAFNLIFFFTGRLFREKQVIISQLDFKQFFKKITFYFFAFLVLFSYMVAYLMSETGPARLWFLASFFFSIYCCMISFYAGICLSISAGRVNLLKKVSVCFIFLILSYSLVHQYNVVSRYSRSFDERERMLKEFNRHVTSDTLLVVPSLPPSGMLYSAEITADTSHYKNQHLRSGYKLHFQVIEN